MLKRNFSLLYLILLILTKQNSIAQVGIGTTTPDASSILDLTSTSKGMLLPRMTTAQRNAIGTPVPGLMIYNTTTSSFNFYNGTTWTSIFSGSSGVNSVTGTANRITIGGTSADPTIDISTSYAGQNSITTLGTIGTGTWNGATIGIPYGGTGATTLSGILKGNGTSAISTATAGTDYSAGTSALGTGLLKSTTGTGSLSIAVAGDFPTLNQNTTGSAATLTTPRSIYGNLFDGSADLTQTIAPSFGGTGISSYTVGDLIYASGTTTLSKLPDVATGNALISGGVGVAPSWGKIGLTTHVSGILPVANGGTGTSTTFTSGSIVFAGASGVYTQDNSKLFWDDTNNRLGVGTASPTSQLHLAAGTAAASTAPLKFTSGTNLTTPENGAVEYDGSHIYITIAGIRYQLDQQNTLKATYQATPADPTSTSSTSGVMMGIAGSITPTISGKVMIVISGDLKNGTNNGNTTVQLRYGTGTAPTNGNALTGTALGGQVNMTAAATNQRVPFSCNAIVTLTVGTAYWIDLALKAVSGSAFTQNLSVSVIEL